MKKITAIITLTLVLLISANQSFAQKVKNRDLKSSEKKAPKWVNSLEKGFIIVVASSPTLEDAQIKALDKVKEQIISSVAENIQTSSEYYRSEDIKNNDSQFTESLKTSTKTRAADIPFMKGISLSKVEAYYWQQVNEIEITKFYYHIKYPFDQFELKKLITEYERAEKAITDQLNAAIAQIETVETVESMGTLIKELQTLSDGFIDVDTRKDHADVAIAKAKNTMKNISIETVSTTLGEIRMSLLVGDRSFTTSRKPKVKSNCAKIIDIKSKGNQWIVTYSYDECYEDPDNKVFVEFKNAYGRANHDYYFNVNAEKINIFVNNDINFSGGDVNETEVSNAKCLISLSSKYDSPFIIEKVILNFGKEAPIIIDNINNEYKGKGQHDLNLTIDQALNTGIYSAKTHSMIKGAIHYRSVKTGEKSVYKMFNQNITTAW